jgi:hypothetical protein
MRSLKTQVLQDTFVRGDHYAEPDIPNVHPSFYSPNFNGL